MLRTTHDQFILAPAGLRTAGTDHQTFAPRILRATAGPSPIRETIINSSDQNFSFAFPTYRFT